VIAKPVPVVEPIVVKPPVVKPLIPPVVAKPPVVKPPVVKTIVAKPLTPPAASTPVVKPPVTKPLIVKPPVVKTIVAKPVIVKPPVVKTIVAKPLTPPAASTPVVKPPVTKPPVVKPPVVKTVVTPNAPSLTPVVKPVVKPMTGPAPVAVKPPVVKPINQTATLGSATGASSTAASGSAASNASRAASSAAAKPVVKPVPTGGAAGKTVAVGPEGYPVQFGKVTGIAARRLGISNAQAAKAARFLKSSPLFEQFLQPLRPANIGLAVGATAAMNLWSQLQEGEKVDLTKAMGFVQEKSFWGGVVGSGVGYALISKVAFTMFPAGIGLLPGMGMLFPVFSGMAGSIAGWELGAGLIEGRDLKELLGEINITQVLGQALGSTAGMLVGAHFGAMLGAIGGPLGAIVGSVLLAPVGAAIAKAIKGMFIPGEDGGEAVEAAKRETQSVLGKIGKLEKILGGGALDAGAAVSVGGVLDSAVGAELPSEEVASMDLETNTAEVKERYDLARKKLQESISAGDQDGARRWLQAMKMSALLYKAAIDNKH
jgi:hypothetical protein